MAKVTWLGEDALHPEDDRGGPTFTIWNGVKFPKGEAVEVTDAKAIAKAKGNQFFEVEDGAPPKPPAGDPPDDENDEEEEEEEEEAPDAPVRTAPKRATTRRRK